MKWFAWSGLVIFILVVFAPTAQAATETRSTQVQVSFEPGQTGANSTIVNMADETTMKYEKDVVLNELPDIEGKYFGPYLQSSLFQFAHKEGYFQFVTNFTFSPQIIMNGATSFWLRIPIVPAQYSWWHLWCDWGYADTIEGSRGSLTQPTNIFLPWFDPSIEYFGSSTPFLGAYEWDSGNVWSTQAGDTYQIKERDTGLYVRLDGIFRSNELFTLSFTGFLNEGESPMVFLTQERNSVDDNQTFRFFQTYELRDSAGAIIDWGYKYDSNQTLEIAAAWAFLFTSGIGKDGMVSYHLQFGGPMSYDFLMWGQNAYGALWHQRIYGFSNGSYLSFYMPFSGTVMNGGSPGVAKTGIDWYVTIMIKQHTQLFDDDGDGVGDDFISIFFVNNTNNYLLFSTPYPVVSSLPAPAYVDIVMTLTPMQTCDLILLGVDLNAEHSGLPTTQSGYWVYYRHEGESASWDASIYVNAHIYPLYNSFDWTDGRWAKVNETKLYWVYDFGWGLGYSFSNASTIYMFLDNGGEFFYTGSYADFVDYVDKHSLTIWEKLFKGITDFVGAVAGKIWDGLQWIWQTLKNLGTWIYNVIDSIFDWLISVAMDIASKVGNIVQGMLYGMPIVLILFAVNYVGSALYQGHIPKLGKERRLLKKLRPRAILRQRAKYQRKLKYPIIQAQKARKDVREWRTQRSEHRTARYESSIHRSRQKELKYQEEKASLLRRR